MTTTAEIERVYREERAGLVRYAHRLTGNVHDAEDAVQDAFVVALEKVEQCTYGEPVAWVTKIVRFAAMPNNGGRRQRAWTVALGDREENLTDSEAGSATADLPCLAEPETATLVGMALSLLGPHQRRAVELRCLEGLSLDETASRMGIRDGHVATAIKKAFAKLQGIKCSVGR